MKLFNINTIETTTHSVPDGVLNGGVGTIGADWSTDPGGSVRFNLFFDILLIFSFNSLRSQAKRMPVAVRCTLISTFLSGDSLTRILYRRGCFHMELSVTLTSLKRHTRRRIMFTVYLGSSRIKNRTNTYASEGLSHLRKYESFSIP